MSSSQKGTIQSYEFEEEEEEYFVKSCDGHVTLSQVACRPGSQRALGRTSGSVGRLEEWLRV